MSEEVERDRVSATAMAWVGTPYHDCAGLKGVGVDCGQLLRCVFVEAGIIEDFAVPPYSPQHFLHRTEEHYLGYVLRHAAEIPRSAARPGDVVLYKIGGCFAHGAIVVAPGLPHVVHAHSVARRVRRGHVDYVHLGMPIKDTKFFSHWR